MDEKITSRDNARVKYACRLAASGAFRKEEGRFFAEGRKLCCELAKDAVLEQLFYTAAAAEKRRLEGEAERLYAAAHRTEVWAAKAERSKTSRLTPSRRARSSRVPTSSIATLFSILRRCSSHEATRRGTEITPCDSAVLLMKRR